MKAMLLAAGRGERMRPLTDRMPKPLLTVAGKPLIVHLIERLSRAGFHDLIINHAWLGEQIIEHLGDGARFDVSIQYSPEPPGALNTGGGIYQALPLLGDGPFLVCNSDIWTDYDFRTLPQDFHGLAHLLLVNNPSHHPQGDFVLHHDQVLDTTGERLTFSGIGLYRAALFNDCQAGNFALAPILRRAMARQPLSGEHYQGQWWDIGTAQRLLALEQFLQTT